MLFDGANREQVTALGDVRRPSIADLFVAVMSPPSREATARQAEVGSQPPSRKATASQGDQRSEKLNE